MNFSPHTTVMNDTGMMENNWFDWFLGFRGCFGCFVVGWLVGLGARIEKYFS